MNRDELIDSIGRIDEELVLETEKLRRQSPRPRWQKWAALAACLCVVIVGITAWSGRWDSGPHQTPGDSGGQEDHADGAHTGEQNDGCVNEPPGGVRPEILVDGKVYYWTGMAQAMSGTDVPGAFVYIIATAETYLPEGYSEYGAVSLVTADAPTEDCQMKAGFSATGTVYTSEETPEAVYVLMSTDWFADRYVRFVTAELEAGYRIAWNGKHYRIINDYNTSHTVDVLPDGAEEIGRLHYVGRDWIPENDLDTNCPRDTRSYALERRSVYYDPADPDHIYVRETFPSQQTFLTRYLKCPVWT